MKSMGSRLNGLLPKSSRYKKLDTKKFKSAIMGENMKEDK
jgi:hypothetical protein